MFGSTIPPFLNPPAPLSLLSPRISPHTCLFCCFWEPNAHTHAHPLMKIFFSSFFRFFFCDLFSLYSWLLIFFPSLNYKFLLGFPHFSHHRKNFVFFSLGSSPPFIPSVASFCDGHLDILLSPPGFFSFCMTLELLALVLVGRYICNLFFPPQRSTSLTPPQVPFLNGMSKPFLHKDIPPQQVSSFFHPCVCHFSQLVCIPGEPPFLLFFVKFQSFFLGPPPLCPPFLCSPIICTGPPNLGLFCIHPIVTLSFRSLF